MGGNTWAFTRGQCRNLVLRELLCQENSKIGIRESEGHLSFVFGGTNKESTYYVHLAFTEQKLGNVIRSRWWSQVDLRNVYRLHVAQDRGVDISPHDHLSLNYSSKSPIYPRTNNISRSLTVIYLCILHSTSRMSITWCFNYRRATTTAISSSL
jgi:hypothetical protein